MDPGRDLFAFLPPDHAFGAQVADFREVVATGHRTGAVSRALAGATGRAVTAGEMWARRTPTGWTLDRLSCSVQRWGAPGQRPFAATTAYWRAGEGPTRWSTLPDEPYLRGLDACLPGAAGGATGNYRVLRYVPLRRFTYRAGDVVHKVKRRSRLADSVARAGALVAAAAGSEVRVPPLLGTRVDVASYAQQAVEGPPASELAAGVDLLRVLAEVGRVHAALHALPGRDLPLQGPEAALPRTVEAADWSAEFLPDAAPVLRAARDLLLATAPGQEGAALATCHGDLVPSHVLAADAGWTVIDLDLAHRGDRYRDVALFLAGLPADVPALADGVAPAGLLDAAERAYLDGYEQRWGSRLDRRRAAWHRAAAELHHLALMPSKDRLRQAAVARGVAAVESAVADLTPAVVR